MALAKLPPRPSGTPNAPLQTQPPSISTGGFLQTLLNDILQFFAALFGRNIVGTSSTVAVSSPTGITQNVTVPIPKVVKPTITAQQAITQAIATETNLNPRDFVSGWYVATNPLWQSEVTNAEINFQEASNGTCGGVSSPGISFQQAAGLATGATAAGLSAIGVGSIGGVGSAGIAAAGTALGTVAGVALPGIGIVIGVISAIFQHHAANVSRDNRAICALLPASNNAFKAIIDAVKAQQISPAQGAAGMDAIPSQFLSQAGPAKNNSPYCNALCEYLIRVRAIAFYWKSQFESME